jgi:AcrR family transcriptional regulator
MPRPKKSKEEIEEMRERILDATVAILKEEGPNALSIRAIAERVGVSHMALYTYFENRDTLMAALRQRQRARMDARHANMLKRAETGDVCQVVRDALVGYTRMAERRPRLYQFLWIEPITQSDCVPSQSQRMEEHLNQLARLIELGIRRGVFVERDPKLAAATVFTLTNGPLILHYGGRLPDDALKERLVTEVLGIAMEYLCKGTE